MSRWIVALLLLAACSGGEPEKRTVVLIPIGPVPAEVLAQLQRELPAIVEREVTIGAEIPRPAAALDARRQQYRGSLLLEELARHDVPGADRVVGIIDADVYAPNLNFIFGQAQLPGRFAVVALPRLRESFRGQPENAARFHERAVKETAHELGHTFGFRHCDEAACVMRFSNSFLDTDRKGARYCSRHELP